MAGKRFETEKLQGAWVAGSVKHLHMGAPGFPPAGGALRGWTVTSGQSDGVMKLSVPHRGPRSRHAPAPANRTVGGAAPCLRVFSRPGQVSEQGA